MSRVVEASGAQVLPAGDVQVTVNAWQAMCAADADLRTKVPVWAGLAGRLHILRGEA